MPKRDSITLISSASLFNTAAARFTTYPADLSIAISGGQIDMVADANSPTVVQRSMLPGSSTIAVSVAITAPGESFAATGKLAAINRTQNGVEYLVETRDPAAE